MAGNGTGGFAGDGGPAIRAELFEPRGVTVDSSGNLVIADTGNPVIDPAGTGSAWPPHRDLLYGRPMTARHIYTVAGTGNFLYSGDGGPAAGAKSASRRCGGRSAGDMPTIADTGNSRIRAVAATTGMLFGHPVTAATSTPWRATARMGSPATASSLAPNSGARRGGGEW